MAVMGGARGFQSSCPPCTVALRGAHVAVLRAGAAGWLALLAH